MSNSIITAVTSASYNMILQLVFRALTFIVNAVLLRYITKEMLGVANVRLSLLYYTIIFISSEAFRKSCLIKSEETVSAQKRKKMINLIWMCVVVAIFSSIGLSFIWIYYLEQPSQELLFQYQVCTLLFALATIVELIAEPLRLFGLSYTFILVKVFIEGVQVASRCLISASLIILFPEKLGLLSFGIGFVASSLLYTISYYLYFFTYISYMTDDDPFPLKCFRDFFPSFDMEAMFDTYYLDLVKTFYKQSLVKQFLTEGEKYIMTVFSILSFGQQGVYDVINNLGSLAARIIFMPIEESYHVFFSLLITRGKSAKDHRSEDVKEAASSLSLVLKVVSLIGLIIVVFGNSYSYLLLQMYGGEVLTDNQGPLLLRTYCVYVFIIAINGITECFMFAAMAEEALAKYNYKMVGFSIIFLTASLVLTKHLGAVGFILANCLNMLLRIGHNIQFIWSFFKDTLYNPIRSVRPSLSVGFTLLISFVMTSMSEHYFCCSRGLENVLLHIGVGAVCLLMVLISVFFTELELAGFIINFIKRRRESERPKTD